MDRMRVCGTCDPGSIPGESTNGKRGETKGLAPLSVQYGPMLCCLDAKNGN